MSEWTIYWLTRLDDLKALGIVVAISGACAVATLALVGAAQRDFGNTETGRALHRVCVRFWPAPIALGFLVALVPSTKQMAAILVLPAVANSEAVQEIGLDLRTLAREWLKAQIEEARK